jgi:hypothetical protein
MDKDSIKPTFFQLFEAINDKSFLKLVRTSKTDKYTKKLTTDKLITLVALAQLDQAKGLRVISSSLHNEDLKKSINLESISHSQLSRKLRDISPDIIKSLFNEIVRRVGSAVGVKRVSEELQRLYLIDSSTISMCLSLYNWAKFRKTKSGVKLHLRLVLCDQEVYPDKAIITPAKPADRTQMDNLVVVEKDALNVFDRGYLDYKKFDNYCATGIRFVSRLKHNALVEILEEREVVQGSPIKHDRMVRLGKAGITKMKYPLRQIETEDSNGNPVVIISNDFQMSAEEIADIYRYRWQIELFFKWIKQHLCIKHLYGTSPVAVENQILIALISYCLLKLLQLKVGYHGSLLTIKRLLDECLYEPLSNFIQKLYRRYGPSTKGRRRINHEAIYQETLRQFEELEVEHLSDLTYDPVIL